MVEGARLESVCTLTGYRGFESLPLRHLKEQSFYAGICILSSDGDGMRTLAAKAATMGSKSSLRRNSSSDDSLRSKNPSLSAISGNGIVGRGFLQVKD